MIRLYITAEDAAMAWVRASATRAALDGQSVKRTDSSVSQEFIGKLGEIKVAQWGNFKLEPLGKDYNLYQGKGDFGNLEVKTTDTIKDGNLLLKKHTPRDLDALLVWIRPPYAELHGWINVGEGWKIGHSPPFKPRVESRRVMRDQLNPMETLDLEKYR